MQDDSSLLSRVETYAADSTLPGCYQARALLNKVYGKDMNFLRADPSGTEARPPHPGETVKEVTALKEREVFPPDRFEIYPNPASNSVFIYYSGRSDKNLTFTISDMLGRKIIERSISPEQRIELSTDQFNNGLYFVTLSEGNLKKDNKTVVIMK